MTKEETIKVMAVLCALYGQGKGDPKMMATAWHLILQDYGYDETCAAVVEFAKNDVRDYATFPAVGKIVQAIEAMRTKRNRAINEVYMAIALNNKAYEDLSETAKAICPPALFEEWKRYSVRHADEFCEHGAKYKAVLRGNLNKLLGGGAA